MELFEDVVFSNVVENICNLVVELLLNGIGFVFFGEV